MIKQILALYTEEEHFIILYVNDKGMFAFSKYLYIPLKPTFRATRKSSVRIRGRQTVPLGT